MLEKHGLRAAAAIEIIVDRQQVRFDDWLRLGVAGRPGASLQSPRPVSLPADADYAQMLAESSVTLEDSINDHCRATASGHHGQDIIAAHANDTRHAPVTMQSMTKLLLATLSRPARPYLRAHGLLQVTKAFNRSALVWEPGR